MLYRSARIPSEPANDRADGRTTVTPRSRRGGTATVSFLAAALLAACGTSTPESAAVSCAPGQIDGDLNVYNWSDFMDPQLLVEFGELHGIRVTEDYYASDDELLARLQTGVRGYDIVFPSDYMVTILVEDGLVMPLDAAAIPNTALLDPRVTEPEYDPGMQHSRPYLFGFTGIGIDRSVVGDVAPSWDLLFDPATVAAHGGRISLLDDSREVMGAALMWLGYSLNTTDEVELAEAEAVLARATSWITTFDSSDPTGLLVGGEVAVAHIWNGLMASADAGDRYELLVPVEGSVQYMSAVAIPATAPHPCTAHTFIDFLLSAESGAALTVATGYATPVLPALDLLPADVREDPLIFPPDDVRDRLFGLVDTGDFEPRYSDAYLRARR